MITRLATPSDCSAIARTQIESYRAAYKDLMPPEYLAAFSYAEQEQDWRDLLAANRAGELLIVAEGPPGAEETGAQGAGEPGSGAQSARGKILGYALVRQVDPAKTGFDCELVSLHVRPGGYRQGTGRALVADAARRMHALNCRSLGLWVLDGNPARHFYERLGGVRRGEQFFELDETTRRREIGYVWDDITTLFAG